MIELVLMLWILPRRFFPLARERGKSGFLWTLAAIGAWLGVEFLVIAVYTIIYLCGTLFFGWPEEIEKQPATFFVYFLALAGGLVGADIIRRMLTRIPTASPFDEPPPPPPADIRA